MHGMIETPLMQRNNVQCHLAMVYLHRLNACAIPLALKLADVA